MKLHLEFTEAQITKIKEIIEHNEHVICTVDNTLETIWIHDDTFDTEFRFTFQGHHKLIISRVFFRNMRCGTLTTLLTELQKICIENNVHNIIIQSAETPEIVNFCNKNHFKPDPFSTMLADELVIGDYILTF